MPNCTHFSEWFPCDYRIFAACKNFIAVHKGAAMKHAWDPVIVWWKDGKKYIEPKGNGIDRDWHIGNNCVYVTETWGIQREHPSPKPLNTLEFIVSRFVRPKGVVLDVFLGSGTTALACHKNGRGCIGIEQNEDYLSIAVRRIEDEIGAGAITEMRKQKHRISKGRKPVK
jgi:DNA modification methylase